MYCPLLQNNLYYSSRSRSVSSNTFFGRTLRKESQWWSWEVHVFLVLPIHLLDRLGVKDWERRVQLRFITLHFQSREMLTTTLAFTLSVSASTLSWSDRQESSPRILWRFILTSSVETFPLYPCSSKSRISTPNIESLDFILFTSNFHKIIIGITNLSFGWSYKKLRIINGITTNCLLDHDYRL